MGMLLRSLGFRDNPFSSYSAENEPEIDRYFVRPPYYDFVTDRGKSCRSLVLFGARGAGKSATRLTFFKEVWHQSQTSTRGPLVVTLDDFSRIVADGIGKVDLGRFVAEVGYLVVESLLVWLAAQEDEDRNLYVQTLTKDEESATMALVRRFYLSRPDFVRSASVREPLKLLNQAWHKRTALWVSQKWEAVAGLVATIAQSLVNRSSGLDLKLEGGLGSLLKADAKDWNDAHFARAILTRLADFARQFGFIGITILVDKADETQQTNNSSASTAALLYPILSNTQLLEVDGVGWALFLWDKVRDEYASDAYPVRLDKIPNATIAWDEAFLSNLIAKRLTHFSGGAVSNFGELCEDSVRRPEALSELIRISMRSPRELIRVLDTIVREHDDEFATSEASHKLVQPTIDRALDKYAVETIRRMFDRVHLQQIARLKMVNFINRDVQQTFRINDQTARNRIRTWADAGIIAQTGTRPAEGGAGGKPSYEYSVIDFRVRRMLERSLSLGIDFEPSDEESEGDA
jgi:hypothetical protein